MSGRMNPRCIGCVRFSLPMLFPVLSVLLSGGRVDLFFHIASRPALLALKALRATVGERLSMLPFDVSPVWLPADTLIGRHCPGNPRRTINWMASSILRRLRDEFGTDRGLSGSAHFCAKSRQILELHFEQQAINEEMFDCLFVAFRLLAVRERTGGDEGNGSRPLLLLPKRWWNKAVSAELSNMGVDTHSAIFGGYLEHLVWRLVRRVSGRTVRFVPEIVSVSEHLGTFDYFIPEYEPLSVLPSSHSEGGETIPGICISLCDTIDPRWRCGTKWYWSPWLNRASVSLVADSLLSFPINLEEQTALHGFGTTLLRRTTSTSCPELNRLPLWNPSWRLHVALFLEEAWHLVRYGLAALNPSAARLRWQLIQYAFLVPSLLWWQAFLSERRIRILVEDYYGSSAAVHALAAARTGCLVVSTERSQEYDHEQIDAERIADVYFMAGIHGLKQSVRPETKRHVVLTGFPSDPLSRDLLQRTPEDIRRSLSPDKPLVLLIDEAGIIHSMEMVFTFYDAMLRELEQSRTFRLLVKSKKKLFVNAMVARYGKRINALAVSGDLFFMDPHCSASCAASVVDLAISMPSTAMFDTMILGKPTAIFNPFQSIYTFLYEQGLKDIAIYADMDILIANLRCYLRGEMPEFGDCRAFAPQINPFGDIHAGDRMGFFLESLRRELALGSESDRAIQAAMAAYRERWGEYSTGSFEALLRTKPGTFEADAGERTATEANRL
ncbi:MAG: hypothetical protein HQL07_05065 [Nitrospirae bacterium]|nr:hypothetical protein [Magnetococcales bacterium]